MAAAQHAANPKGRLEVTRDRDLARQDVTRLESDINEGRLAPSTPDYMAAVSKAVAFEHALSRGTLIAQASDTAAQAPLSKSTTSSTPPTPPDCGTRAFLDQFPPQSGQTIAVRREVDPQWGVREIDLLGRPVRVWTQYARNHPWLRKPEPNCLYIVRPSLTQQAANAQFVHLYQTGNDGRTAWAYAHNAKKLTGAAKGERSTAKPVGFPGGKNDAGHLIASEFGGGMDPVNLVTMPAPMNRGHKANTARRHGFDHLADLMDRYAADAPAKDQPPLNGAGKRVTPRYRKVEGDIRRDHAAAPGPISFKVEPSTYYDSHAGRDVTDLLTVTVYGRGTPREYHVDCEVLA